MTRPSSTAATMVASSDAVESSAAGRASEGGAPVKVGDLLAGKYRIDGVPAAGSILLNGVAIAPGTLVTLAQLNAGALTFAPAADANGTGYASLTFSVQDSAGAFDSTPNTITVDVTPQPDAAVISGVASGATVEDTTPEGELVS